MACFFRSFIYVCFLGGIKSGILIDFFSKSLSLPMDAVRIKHLQANHTIGAKAIFRFSCFYLSPYIYFLIAV